MLEIKQLTQDIEALRESLYRIIEQKEYKLDHSEVLDVSMKLNTAILNFNKLLKEKC